MQSTLVHPLMFTKKRKTTDATEKTPGKTMEEKVQPVRPLFSKSHNNKSSKKSTHPKVNRKILKNFDHLDEKAHQHGLLENLSAEFKDLEENGFQVVENILESDMCDRLVQDMKNWMVAARHPWVKADDVTTWTPSNLVYLLKRFICQQYGAGQAEWSWEVRQHPRVYDLFSRLWQEKELLVSFDAFSLGAPHELTGARLYAADSVKKQKTSNMEEKVNEAVNKNRWDHFDQAQEKQGRWCIQGMAALIGIGAEDACFSVWKYSHHFFSEYCQAFPAKDKKDDGQNITKEGIAWLTRQVYCVMHGKNKCNVGTCTHAKHPELIRVVMPKGSIVLWDSRAAHFAGQPIAARKDPVWRATVYTCFMPKRFARPEVVKRRIELFRKGVSTNHWPITCTEFMSEPFHVRDKLLCDSKNCVLENGMCVNTKHVKCQVPQIQEKDLTELGKKLVGIIPY